MDGESAAATEAVATATGRSVTTMKAGQHRKEVTEVLSTARDGLSSQKSARRDGTRRLASQGRAAAEGRDGSLSDRPENPTKTPHTTEQRCETTSNDE